MFETVVLGLGEGIQPTLRFFARRLRQCRVGLIRTAGNYKRRIKKRDEEFAGMAGQDVIMLRLETSESRKEGLYLRFNPERRK